MRALILMLSLLLASTSYAEFMAEPMLGFATGSLTGEGANGTPMAPTKYNGVVPGLRVGYRMGKMWWMALEGTQIIAKGKANSTDYDIATTNVGVLLGADFGRNRAFAGFMPMSSSSHKDSTDEIKFTGSAFKLGYASYLTPRWTVNLEVLVHQYKKLSLNGTEADVSAVYAKLNDVPLIASLGFVF